MRVKWDNVITLILLLIAIIIGVQNCGEITEFLGTMPRAVSPRYPEDRILGLLAFAMVGILIAGIVRIVARN